MFLIACCVFARTSITAITIAWAFHLSFIFFPCRRRCRCWCMLGHVVVRERCGIGWLLESLVAQTITNPNPFSSMSVECPHSTSPAKRKLILLLLFGMHTGTIRAHSYLFLHRAFTPSSRFSSLCLSGCLSRSSSFHVSIDAQVCPTGVVLFVQVQLQYCDLFSRWIKTLSRIRFVAGQYWFRNEVSVHPVPSSSLPIRWLGGSVGMENGARQRKRVKEERNMRPMDVEL